MTDDLTIAVTHEGQTWRAGVRADEKADQLLLKSLHHFDIDPKRKEDWALERTGAGKGERERDRDEEREEIVLGDPIADQLASGDTVALRRRDADRREAASGSY